MNSAYFETRFRVPKPPHHWPEAFAIITAWETTGEDWPEEKNKVADEALQVDLSDRAVWHQRVIGFSPKTGHAEPGWACDLSFDEACDLGQQFVQDAIYWVEGDRLSVSYCDQRRGLVAVGSFRERIADET